MEFKYGDIISLKDGVMPQMSLDKEIFFSLPDDKDDKIKTYWSLPEDAFETDDMGFVYLKSEYAKKLRWGVDAVIRVDDDKGYKIWLKVKLTCENISEHVWIRVTDINLTDSTFYGVVDNYIIWVSGKYSCGDGIVEGFDKIEEIIEEDFPK